MTEQPQATPDPAASGMTAGDPLTSDSPGYLDEVAEEASEESSANLTDAGATSDISSPQIDESAGGAGAG